MVAQLYTDGGARGNPGPAGIGMYLLPDDGKPIARSKFIGRATNNQAEYEALLAGLKLAYERGVSHLSVYMDSELIVKQLMREYRVKDAKLKPLYQAVCEQLESFEQVSFTHVRREKNAMADRLVNEAIDNHS